MDSKSRTAYAKPGEWDAQKATIKRLYIDEDKKLKDVAEIMEKEFNFRATQRMYKDRLAKWGLRKYLNSDAVMDIARNQAGHSTAGRKVKEYSRPGRAAVKSTTVKRYLDRNRHLLEQFHAASEVKRDGIQTPPPTPPRMLTPPDSLRVAEDAIIATKELLDAIPFEFGSDDGPKWLESQEKALCFANILFFATKHQNGSVVSRLRYANEGWLERILRDPYSNFPLHFLLRFKATDVGKPLAFTLGQVETVSRSIHGSRHPNSRLWKSLLEGLAKTEFEGLDKAEFEGLTNRLQGVCLDVWRSLITARASTLVMPSDNALFLSWLRALCNQASNPQPRTLYAVAWVFAYLGEFEQAMGTMLELQPLLVGMSKSFPVHHFAAHLEAEKGNYRGAADKLKEVLDTSFSVMSWDMDLIEMYGIELENFVTMAGEDQKAKAARDRGLVCSTRQKFVEIDLGKE